MQLSRLVFVVSPSENTPPRTAVLPSKAVPAMRRFTAALPCAASAPPSVAALLDTVQPDSVTSIGSVAATKLKAPPSKAPNGSTSCASPTTALLSLVVELAVLLANVQLLNTNAEASRKYTAPPRGSTPLAMLALNAVSFTAAVVPMA